MTLNPNAIEFIPKSLTSVPSSSHSSSQPLISNKKSKNKRKNIIKLSNRIKDNNSNHRNRKEIINNSIWNDNDFPTLTTCNKRELDNYNDFPTYSVIVSSNKYNENDDSNDTNSSDKNILVITTWNRNSYDENDDISNDINDINDNDENIKSNLNESNNNTSIIHLKPRMKFSGYAKKFEERWITMAREIGEKQRIKNVTKTIQVNNDKIDDIKSWHHILSPVIKYNISDVRDNDSGSDSDNEFNNSDVRNHLIINGNLKYSELDWIKALKSNDSEMISTIINSGFDWVDTTIEEEESNTITNDNKPNKISSLHYCAKYNYCICLELLVSPSISSSFDIDSRDRKYKMTAMHRAALHGHKEAIQILLNRGSDPSAKDKIGETCVHKAVRSNNNNCVVLLINTNKVKINLKNRRRENAMILCKTKEIAQTLLSNGSEIDNVNIDGDDILSITARRGDHKLLSTLINCNSLNRIQYQQLLTSNNDQNIPRTTAIHEACKFGFENCLKMIIASELYDINSTANPEQVSPLLLSSLNGNVNMVNLLLSAGADPTIECAIGYNSLVAALLSKHVDCANAIIRYHPSILQKLNEQKEHCLDVLFKHVNNNDSNQRKSDMQQYIPCIAAVILHPQGFNLSKQFIYKICGNDNAKIMLENFFTHNHYDMNISANKMPIYFNMDMRKWIKGKEDVVINVKNNRLFSYAFLLNHASPVLANMLNDQENHRDEDGRIYLDFTNNEFPEFDLLLSFINTRQDVTTNVNADTLISLLILSNKLEIQQLQYMCEARIAISFKAYDKSVLSQLCEALQLKRLPVLCKVLRNKSTIRNCYDEDIIDLLLSNHDEKWINFIAESVLGSRYDLTNVLLEKKKSNIWLNLNLSSSLVTTDIVKRQCLQKVELASLNILKIYHTIDKDNDNNNFYHIILKSLFGSSVTDKIFKKILYEEPCVGWDNNICLSKISTKSLISLNDLRGRIDEITPSFLLLLNFREELFVSEKDKDIYIFAVNDEENKDKPVKANSIVLAQCGKFDAMIRFQRAQLLEISATSDDMITNLEMLDISYDHLNVIVRFLYTGILLLSKDINLSELIHNPKSLSESTARLWLNYLIELLFIAEEYLIITLKDQIEMLLLAILTNNNHYSKYLFLVANTLSMKLLALSSSACYLINVNKNVKTNTVNDLLDNDDDDDDDFAEEDLIEMMMKTIMSSYDT